MGPRPPRWLSRIESTQLLDGELRLRAPLHLLDATARIWRVPSGSRTDGSSVPDLARGLMPRWDLILAAGALHDVAYRGRPLHLSRDGGGSYQEISVSRAQADDLWRQGAWAEVEIRWREHPPGSRWERIKRRADRARRGVQIAAGYRALRMLGRWAWQGAEAMA